MKKSDNTKKLSINTVTVRKLETELTPDQLQIVNGAGRDPVPSGGCGSVRSVC